MNKCDIAHNDCDAGECGNSAEKNIIQKRIDGWKKIGYTCLKVSAKTQEGFTDLAEIMRNKVTALVGQSGVGKSSIINALCPSSDLKTAGLSRKYERGNHTTTQGVLLKIAIDSSLAKNARASVIDTPGVRRFALNGIAKSDLAFYFKEIKELVGTCSFGMSCTHTSESGCSILAAVKSGAFSKERYESFTRIADELENAREQD
jgi:ribosome biogenesis GTPase